MFSNRFFLRGFTPFCFMNFMTLPLLVDLLLNFCWVDSFFYASFLASDPLPSLDGTCFFNFCAICCVPCLCRSFFRPFFALAPLSSPPMILLRARVLPIYFFLVYFRRPNSWGHSFRDRPFGLFADRTAPLVSRFLLPPQSSCRRGGAFLVPLFFDPSSRSSPHA